MKLKSRDKTCSCTRENISNCVCSCERGGLFVTDVVTRDYISTLFDIIANDHNELVKQINQIEVSREHILAMKTRIREMHRSLRRFHAVSPSPMKLPAKRIR